MRQLKHDIQNSVKKTIVIFAMLMVQASVFAGTVRTYSSNFKFPIPANLNSSKGWMAEAKIKIEDSYIIHDLDVGINLNHTSAFDLQIFLQSPAGTQICLNGYTFVEFFEGADYIDTIFDDEATVFIEQGQPPFTGRFKPRAGNALRAFNNQNTNGIWRIRIYDAFYYDSGILNSVELMFEVPEPATGIILILGITLIAKRRPRQKH